MPALDMAAKINMSFASPVKQPSQKTYCRKTSAGRMLHNFLVTIGGYLGAKVVWAIIVTLHVGRLPWGHLSPEVATIYDLGTAMSVLGAMWAVAMFDHTKIHTN